MPYEGLKAIIDQARDEARQQDTEPPNVCPISGTLLDINGRGVRNCPDGDYRWDGGPKEQPSDFST